MEVCRHGNRSDLPVGFQYTLPIRNPWTNIKCTNAMGTRKQTPERKLYNTRGTFYNPIQPIVSARFLIIDFHNSTIEQLCVYVCVFSCYEEPIGDVQRRFNSLRGHWCVLPASWDKKMNSLEINQHSYRRYVLNSDLLLLRISEMISIQHVLKLNQTILQASIMTF